jgi:hypothetical protein
MILTQYSALPIELLLLQVHPSVLVDFDYQIYLNSVLPLVSEDLVVSRDAIFCKSLSKQPTIVLYCSGDTSISLENIYGTKGYLSLQSLSIKSGLDYYLCQKNSIGPS